MTKLVIPFGLLLFVLFFGCKEEITPEECTIPTPISIDTCQFLSFKMDGAHCALDRSSHTFYYSINDYELDFSPLIEIEEVELDVFIDENEMTNFSTNDLGIVKVNEPLSVKFIFCDNTEEEYQLIFTRLPIIQIATNGENVSSDPKVLIDFRLNDPDFLINEMPQREFVSFSGIEFRGGSAQAHPKKSYGLEIWEDETGAVKKNVSLLGMRKDDDWILDAMYIDKARMRNRVSTDLWLDFQELHYQNEEPKAKSGTHGKFVEVFIDSEYRGLYVFTERVDRKLLKLKEYESGGDYGLLYKSISWSGIVVFSEYVDFDSSSLSWDGWIQKYPKTNDLILWNPLANFIQFVIESSDADFQNQIGQKLNVENAIDYYIFLNLLRADDNTGKNLYFGKYKLSDLFFMVPWDLNATWGQWRDGGTSSPTGVLSNGLFNRLLETNASNFKTQLKQRWSSARNDVLEKNNLMSYFEKYADEMQQNGSFQREKTKWNIQNTLSDEINYTDDWLEERLAFLDDYFENL